MDEKATPYVKRGDFVTRDIAGETIVVPVRSHVGDLESIYTLNETAALVWRLIDGRHSRGEIVESVCSEYDVAREQAQQDVSDILRSFRESALIE